ncbi:S-layer homology domain-containing protein [Cohnella sp. GbtcB17]|uniref:S-layer homology domain-containing protein n=1 Tax=Cohnella sp. GbtcB17 TaxID=2824762 RepID=UPI001C309062|nr:S-layer homology domain-containing protein [Cohnella sp. GbtcB17]
MKDMRERWIIVFLVFVLCCASFPGWMATGGIVYAADDFAGGDGTTGDPYQIESADQLDRVRDYLDSHFVLNHDIDMRAFDADHPWEPIGDETIPFTGSLDGRNFKITNLVINAPASSQPVGLFGVVAGTSSFIQNLIIDAVEVRGLDYVGVLAGRNSTTIHNVGVAGNVYGQNFVGGLAGASADSHLTNSYATGDVFGTNDVGGLSGRVDNGVVSYSYAAGDVSSPVDVGGLIGKQEDTHVSYSYAVGNVTGCEDVGGLVGDNGDNSLISNSYATGAVTGSCESGYPGDSVGGLVGDNSDGDIETSYAIGRVIGGSNAGSLVGISGSGYVDNSFYNMETTGQSDVSGQGLTSDEMKDKQNYTGWDFDTVWNMEAPHHGGYPYVKAIQAFVTYAGNGTDGSGERTSSQSYLPGSFVEIQDISHEWTRAGYRFNGWNTAADGSGDAYGAHQTITLSGNILLYANWKQPAVPAIATPTDGEYTNNRLPAISGLADEGVSVVIRLDGSEAATVTTAADGSWSWTPPGGLADGLHTVSAGVVDSTGNPVSLSAEHAFTVDTVPPVIALSGDATVTLTAGTSFVDPGVTVADAEGDIVASVTGSVDHQVPGTYTLRYDATDRAGNAAVPVIRTVQVIPRSSGGDIYQPSNNANLVRLIVKAKEGDLALTPAFPAGTTRYQAETTANEATIEAILSDAKATVTLDKTNLVGGITVALDEGDNAFELIVRAESGALKTYNLTIRRLTKPEEPGTVTPVCTFRDIKGHWAELPICEAFEIGIVEGRSEAAFQPQADITRIEFAAMLLRALGTDTGPAERALPFTDQGRIPAWASDVVGTAVENGVLQGYPDRTLRPMQRVSRSEMVVIMARAMKWESEPGGTAFADDADIPHWASGYVQGAVRRNLVQGREGNRFSPSDPATRAEATALLLRLWRNLSVAH